MAAPISLARGYLLMVLRGHHIAPKRTEEIVIRKTALISLLTYRDNSGRIGIDLLSHV